MDKIVDKLLNYALFAGSITLFLTLTYFMWKKMTSSQSEYMIFKSEYFKSFSGKGWLSRVWDALMGKKD